MPHQSKVELLCLYVEAELFFYQPVIICLMARRIIAHFDGHYITKNHGWDDRKTNYWGHAKLYFSLHHLYYK